jgi:hypothetical protein
MISTECQTSRVKSSSPAFDRRRPGRIENSPAALIPLLRQSPVTAESDFNDDDLRPSRGIATAVLISSMFWLPFLFALR